MPIVQFYETTIVAREHNYSIRALSVSESAMLNPNILNNEPDLLGSLNLAYLAKVESPALLPYALATLLLESEAHAAVSRFNALSAAAYLALPAPARPDNVCLAFSEQVAYADLIPFEASPLALHGLASIFAHPTTLGIGALVGFAAVGAMSPLLLVTVPLGIVLVGAAKPVGEALGAGLKNQILKMMGQP